MAPFLVGVLVGLVIGVVGMIWFSSTLPDIP